MTGPARVACPYRGLMPYNEEDAEFFFGREAESGDHHGQPPGGAADLALRRRAASAKARSSAPASPAASTGSSRRMARRAADDDEAGGGPDWPWQFLVWSSDPVRGLLAKVEEAVRKALGDCPVEPVESGLPLDDALDAWCARLGSEVRPPASC